MKVALSGMILGASMLGANAETYTFANADGTQGGSITADEFGISGPAGMMCTPSPEHGTAYSGYALPATQAEQTTLLADYEDGTTLAFLCGINGQVIDDARGAPHVGDSILLKLEGTATECGPERIRNGSDDPGAGDSSSSSGGVVGARLFQPEVTAKVLYKCILGKSHAGPSNVQAELRVKEKAGIADDTIVSGNAAPVSMTLLRSGPKEFAATESMVFDLGTNKPHSAYYSSDGTADGCGENDPCLGSIRLSATGFDSKDVSSALSGAWASDASVPYFGFDTAACNAAEQSPKPGISEYDACGMKKQEKQGGSGLLTPFQCPFNSGLNSNGREANVDTCIAAGKALFIHNTCAQGRTTAQTVQLSNTAFSVQLSWSDAAYKSGPPANTLSIPVASQTLAHGTTTADWTITGVTDVAEVQGLYVKDKDSDFSQLVTVSGDSVTVTNVPISVTTLQLRGAVLLESTCVYTDSQIGADLTVSASAPNLYSGGQFTMANACDGKFTYSLGAGETITGIHAPGKDVTIRFCDGAESAAACKAGTRSATASQGFAVIEGACDNVHADDVGALIEIQGKAPARVVCPGACKAVDLGKVTLDWSVEFALSLNDGANNNKLTATEASDYANENAGKTQTTHLASFNQCGADGKVYGSAVTGCELAAASGLTKASEFVSLFKTCGATSSDSPSVYLVSQFEVTLMDGSKLHFCNAKVLSIKQESMRGESTASVGIVAEVANAADAMTAAFSFIGYEACANGQYKLKATMDVDTDATNVTITEDDGTFAQLEDGESSVGYDASAGVLTFETVCADICSVGGAYDDQYDLEVLLDSADTDAQLHIDAQIEVKGTPCGVTDDNLDRGSVALDLYGVDKDANFDCSTASPSADQSLITPNNNDLCASINVTGMGSGTLRVVSEELTRKSPGSAPEKVSGSFFTLPSYANGEHKSDRGRQLFPEDAMTEYTLTIVWEQALSRRLLRTTHVFGAGEKSAKSSIFILPASAQIQDAAESLDAASENATDTTETAEEDEGLSGGAIAGIIAGGVVVAGGIAYVAMQAQGSGLPLSRPQQAGYSVVRRSERFSTMNF